MHFSTTKSFFFEELPWNCIMSSSVIRIQIVTWITHCVRRNQPSEPNHLQFESDDSIKVAA